MTESRPAKRDVFLTGLLVGLLAGGSAGALLGYSLQPTPPDPKAAIENRDEAGAIRGRISYQGTPIPFATIAATGPNNVMTGGSAGEDGTFLMPAPPKGTLKFQVFVPAKLPGNLKVPEKYTRGAPVEATFPYEGGEQTFDIDLK